jgi:hypothetical protein
MTMNMVDAYLAGTVKMMEAIGVASPPPKPCRDSMVPPPAVVSLLEVLYPFYWMKLASGLLDNLEKTLPAAATAASAAASVVMPSVLDSAPLKTSLPTGAPAAPAAPATGWGPMP